MDWKARTKEKCLWSMALIFFGGAVCLFSYRLPNLPSGAQQDSLSIALNAWCISQIGLDEHGRSFPLVFEAFGDFKSPALIYIVAFFFKLGGPNLRWLRFFCASMIFCVTLLVSFVELEKGVTESESPVATTNIWASITLFIGLLFSSWWLIPSRLGVEAALIPLWAWIVLATTQRFLVDPRFKTAFFSGIFAALGSYLYPAMRGYLIVHPLILIVSLVWGKHIIELGRRLRWGAISILTATLVLIPWILDSFGPRSGWVRFEQTARPLVKIGQVFRNFWIHLSPDFLFFKGSPHPLLHTGFGGELNLVWVLPLTIGGLLRGYRAVAHRDGFSIFLLLFLAAGILPAAITVSDLPHPFRSLAASVSIALLVAEGWRWLLRRMENTSLGLLPSFALGFLVIGVSISGTIHYFHQRIPEIDLHGLFQTQRPTNEQVQLISLTRPHSVTSIGIRWGALQAGVAPQLLCRD